MACFFSADTQGGGEAQEACTGHARTPLSASIQVSSCPAAQVPRCRACRARQSGPAAGECVREVRLVAQPPNSRPIQPPPLSPLSPCFSPSATARSVAPPAPLRPRQVPSPGIRRARVGLRSSCRSRDFRSKVAVALSRADNVAPNGPPLHPKYQGFSMPATRPCLSRGILEPRRSRCRPGKGARGSRTRGMGPRTGRSSPSKRPPGVSPKTRGY